METRRDRRDDRGVLRGANARPGQGKAAMEPAADRGVDDDGARRGLGLLAGAAMGSPPVIGGDDLADRPGTFHDLL